MPTPEWKKYKKKRLVGFCGFKGVGKTLAAKALADEGYTDVQFSGGLKAMLRAFLEYNGVENPEMYTDDWYKNHRSRYFCDKEFRHAMQTLGTEWGRNQIGTDFWINAWTRRIQMFDKITVSDVRFPDEVDAIRSKGGIIIRVFRPSFVNVDNHESEANMMKLTADYEVVNHINVEPFQKKIRKIVDEHFANGK